MRELTPGQADLLDRIAAVQPDAVVIGWRGTGEGGRGNGGPVVRFPDGETHVIPRTGRKSGRIEQYAA